MSWGGSEFFSYHGTEFSGEELLDAHFTTPAGHNGVTFLASAGDSGTFAGVNWPAISPHVLSVGGTSLYINADGSYAKEYSWIGTSGGGSAVEPTPSYQTSVDFVGKRVDPDVAYNADPTTGFAVYDSFGARNHVGWQVVGGTSAGAPQWGALVAIANQGRALAGSDTLDGLSQTLPLIYSLYHSPAGVDYFTYTGYFHDIIDPAGRFQAAGGGYDQLTGLGTPKAKEIVNVLASTALTSPPPPIQIPPVSSSLAVTVVSSLPKAVIGPAAGSMTLRLSNISSSDFNGPLSIALYATTDGSITSTDIPFATIPMHCAIPAHKKTNMMVRFTYPTNIPNGRYRLAVAVTATNAGTPPANAVAPGVVAISAPVVDLLAAAVQSKVSVKPGGRKSISVRLKNIGNWAASGPVTISLVASSDQAVDPADDANLKTLTKKITLLPGRLMVLPLQFVAPSSMSPGTYSLIATVSSSTRPPDVDPSDKLVVIATTK